MAAGRPGFLYSTAGFHPHNAKDWKEPASANLVRRLVQQHPGTVVAIGECGLDFDRNFSEPATQVDVFERQLQLARELGLPVFLHERAAHGEFLGVLQRYAPDVPSVVHCFTGTADEARAYVRLPNVHIGVTGWVCDSRRNQALLAALEGGAVPLDRLMIETDAPYLSPVLRSVHRNEPVLLHHVVSALARAYRVPETQVARVAFENTTRFFRLK